MLQVFTYVYINPLEKCLFYMGQVDQFESKSLVKWECELIIIHAHSSSSSLCCFTPFTHPMFIYLAYDAARQS